MSANAWRRRRRNQWNPRPTDLRRVQRLMDRHGTRCDVARLAFPHVSDAVADFLLWEMTPFPLVQGAATLPYLRRIRSRRQPRRTR